jgi:hypothetical protein
VPTLLATPALHEVAVFLASASQLVLDLGDLFVECDARSHFPMLPNRFRVALAQSIHSAVTSRP